MTAEETYAMPAHGWTCFHCGETFTTVGAAKDHFGFDPSYEPACRIKLGAELGLLMALRQAEKDLVDAWNCIHNESAEGIRAMRRAEGRNKRHLILAEELGYERGLRDARNEAAA